MHILVTGGLGYIWSHTIVQLLERGYEVTIIDNLSNSDKTALQTFTQLTWTSATFFPYDLRDKKQLSELFAAHTFDAVIHFAGLKAVGESCAQPFLYYQNNIVWTLNLLEVMWEAKVNKLIFSSSAGIYDTHYGEAPFDENDRTWFCAHPYGTTKHIIEQLLHDLSLWKWLHCICLRYFNPIGAHPSGLLWEDPKGIPNNIFPYLMRVAVGKYDMFHIFGDDYATRDGTCIRDYIHIQDLANAHLSALEKLDEIADGAMQTINIGTWQWTTVLEMIHMLEEVIWTSLPYDVAERRDGDVAETTADVTKAKKLLWRTASHTVKQAIQDGRNHYANK